MMLPRRSAAHERATLITLAFLALITVSVPSCASEEETDRVAGALGLQAGMTVAEVGAGKGKATIAVAKIVGPAGRVYSTEIDAEQRQTIRTAVQAAGLSNVTVIEAGTESTGLPDSCCDAIFLQSVYHHLSKPAQIDAGLLRALRAGGTLMVIDFPPTIWLSPWTPKDVPANRGGHGIPATILIEELQAAGFQRVSLDEGWDRGWLGQRYYSAVFRKPGAAPTSPRS